MAFLFFIQTSLIRSAIWIYKYRIMYIFYNINEYRIIFTNINQTILTFKGYEVPVLSYILNSD